MAGNISNYIGPRPKQQWCTVKSAVNKQDKLFFGFIFFFHTLEVNRVCHVRLANYNKSSNIDKSNIDEKARKQSINHLILPKSLGLGRYPSSS